MWYNICSAWFLDTVQLKGNLTHTDKAQTTYWQKARSFINPYWRVQEGKPAKVNF